MLAAKLMYEIFSRCMRRGVAYYLNRSTDIDTRKQLMGHRESSPRIKQRRSRSSFPKFRLNRLF
ncbi:hypothetical protein V1504DRAFT_458880 [Lipomyces starkeyi]